MNVSQIILFWLVIVVSEANLNKFSIIFLLVFIFVSYSLSHWPSTHFFSNLNVGLSIWMVNEASTSKEILVIYHIQFLLQLWFLFLSIPFRPVIPISHCNLFSLITLKFSLFRFPSKIFHFVFFFYFCFSNFVFFSASMTLY